MTIEGNIKNTNQPCTTFHNYKTDMTLDKTIDTED